MRAPSERRWNGALASAAAFMVLCCAAGPAVVGAVAGGALGGWLGIVSAAGVAMALALILIAWHVAVN